MSDISLIAASSSLFELTLGTITAIKFPLLQL